MRRMYSEQELTNVIKAVFEQELEDGALDENVADAVDAYLVEHPVDVTAITGLDIAPKDVTASGNITAPSIIENMDPLDYRFTDHERIQNNSFIYAGAVKNGNKLTLVVFGSLTRTTGDDTNNFACAFTLSESVASKIYPYSVGGVNNLVAVNKLVMFSGVDSLTDSVSYMIQKSGRVLNIYLRNMSSLTDETTYLYRIEVTFLLNDNLIPEE